MQELFNKTYLNRRVLVTGHTGFKGSWLSILLNKLGADVYGYALNPPSCPNMFTEANIAKDIESHIGDIRDYENLLRVMKQVKPEIIIHMAAQPLVRESYNNPVETYNINVMGTVNLLEAVRHTPEAKVVINVTTDKCYENREWHWGYRENEAIGGYDPYSSSKGCSELVTASYRNSFFNPSTFSQHGVAIATARAGNVIGGGDWAQDRLIPDFIRAISNGEKVRIRSPYSIRPWQHVLEPLSGYLTLAAKLFSDGPRFGEGWNFGPNDNDARNVEWIINTICSMWGEGASYEVDTRLHPHEANYLKLDCSKAKAELGWNPLWDIEKTLKSIVDWNKAFINNNDIKAFSENQIEEYFKRI